jgi:cation:H+ antiporter
MNMVLSAAFVLASIVVLFFGAEFSLDASEKIGKKLGLSPLAIGMLIIGFGTSLPELFVAHIAGIQGKGEMAMGALLGSNIANMFLILGITGIITPLAMKGNTLRDQLWVHVSLAGALSIALSASGFGILQGILLFVVSAFYLFFLYQDLEEEEAEAPAKAEVESFNPLKVLFKLIAGFSMLYIGGELLVKGASDLVLSLGVSEYIVSAIVIAFGTSFPELVTSILAAVKKKDTDIIIGNIIGSNLFNCSFILGSLGVYNFVFSQSFLFELVCLFVGSMFFVLLYYLKKNFYWKSSIFFLLFYAGVLGHWFKVY